MSDINISYLRPYNKYETMGIYLHIRIFTSCEICTLIRETRTLVFYNITYIMCTKDSLIIKLYNIEVLKVVGLKSFYP